MVAQLRQRAMGVRRARPDAPPRGEHQRRRDLRIGAADLRPAPGRRAWRRVPAPVTPATKTPTPATKTRFRNSGTSRTGASPVQPFSRPLRGAGPADFHDPEGFLVRPDYKLFMIMVNAAFRYGFR